MSKKFGKGLVAALTGGGVAGFALGIVDKLLNPLKETQDAIDNMLKKSDDIVANAKQFGTTSGKLARLVAIAQSTGLDQQSLFTMLTKFQGAIAEATADPTKETSVRQFAPKLLRDENGKPLKNQPEPDIASLFFEFIQQSQKLNKSDQFLAQKDVFGEKLILKMSDFAQSDLVKQNKLLGGPSAEQLTKGFNKTGDLNDLKDLLTAKRTLNDDFTKSKIINADMVKQQDARAQLDLDRENKQIQSYQSLAEISIATNTVLNWLKEIALKLTDLAVTFSSVNNIIKKIAGARALRLFLKDGKE